MKVKRETPDELILESQPWFMGILFIVLILGFVGVGLNMILTDGDWNGLFLIGAGLGTGGLLFALMVERTQIWADRNAGTLVYRRQSVFRRTEDSIPLSSIVGAEVQSRAPRNGSVSRMTIVVKDGGTDRVGIGTVWISGGGPGRAARALNRWLGVENRLHF